MMLVAVRPEVDAILQPLFDQGRITKVELVREEPLELLVHYRDSFANECALRKALGRAGAKWIDEIGPGIMEANWRKRA